MGETAMNYHSSLNEMFQQNTSQFAIFYVSEKPPRRFFSGFLIYFFHYLYPGLRWRRPGHSLGKN